MRTDRETTRLVRSWLEEGATALPDRVLDAVLDQVPATPQRRSLWPPRRLEAMNNMLKVALSAAAVVVVAVIGIQLLGPAAPGGVGGTPTATASPTPIGGSVDYQLDGAPVTTEVNAVADGASVSGTAVTTFVKGTHTVRLECAAQDGDTWVLGGTIERTTVPGERADAWSAIIVKDGSPQQIHIWLSDDKSEGIDCDGWLAAIAFSTITASNFSAVESGALVPPPGLAP